MKAILYTLPLVILVYCNNEIIKTRPVCISEIGWTFQIPNHLKFEDSAFNSSGKIAWDSITLTETSVLFKIKVDYFNTFTAVLQRDTGSYASWRASLDSQNKTYFELMRLNEKNKLIDTSYGSKIIGNVPFQKEVIKVLNIKNNDTATICHYYGKLTNYTIVFSYSFDKNDYKRDFEDMIWSSQFQK